MIRFQIGNSTYGRLLLLIGLLIAAPLAILPFYPEDARYAQSFLIPSVVSVILGAVLCLFAPKHEESVAEWQSPLQKGSIPVLFAWSCATVAGAVPFVLSNQLSFILALFESVSGWTTTGLTVVDVTKMPYIFLFHRSFMQYCGGIGFIIMIAMLAHGKQSMSLYNAEGHPDRLMPTLKGTAQMIFLIYNGFLIIGTLLYNIFGMGLFDAVCHTMSALSTAGFTTRAGSIGEYRSFPIEIITVVLMLIGASNFAVLLLLVRRKFRQMFNCSEVKFMIGLLLVFVPLAAFSLYAETGAGIGESFRQSLFGVVTTFSTTGYATMNYAQWPQFAIGLLLLLMVIGGGTGSTAGGIKLIRTHLLIRITQENVRSRILPARNVSMQFYQGAQAKIPIDDSVVRDTAGFIACYAGVLMIGTLLVTLTSGCSLFDATFEFASAFGTVGISNGLTNANTPTATLIVEMIGMLLGRLEIFIVFIGIYSGMRALGQHLRKIIF